MHDVTGEFNSDGMLSALNVGTLGSANYTANATGTTQMAAQGVSGGIVQMAAQGVGGGGGSSSESPSSDVQRIEVTGKKPSGDGSGSPRQLSEGNEAHRLFQNYAKKFGYQPEVPLINQTSGKSAGRADLAHFAERKVWEIKKDNFLGYVTGNVQIWQYTDNTGFQAGDDLSFLPYKDIITLQGATNSYTYENTGNGLILYNVNRPQNAVEEAVSHFLNSLAHPKGSGADPYGEMPSVVPPVGPGPIILPP
jgi:hypothetical protein